jgi:hypothetical protein
VAPAWRCSRQIPAKIAKNCQKTLFYVSFLNKQSTIDSTTMHLWGHCRALVASSGRFLDVFGCQWVLLSPVSAFFSAFSGHKQDQTADLSGF